MLRVRAAMKEENKNNVRQTELQKALAEGFLQDDYNAFITLTYKTEGSVSYAYARRTFGRFMHAVRCSLYKETCTYRMPLVPVVESYPGRPLCSGAPYFPTERTHIHFCIKLPGNPLDHKEMIRRKWLDAGGACGDPSVYCPNGENWYIPLSEPAEIEAYVNYLLKQCCTDSEPLLLDFTIRKFRAV